MTVTTRESGARPALRVEIDRVSPSVAALQPEQWSRLVGDASDVMRQNRGYLLSYASAFSNEQLVASAWNGDELAGIGVAIVMVRPNGERLFTISFSGVFGTRLARSFWVTDEREREPVVAFLLRELVEYARARDFGRAVISYCPVGDTALARTAEELGFRGGTVLDDFAVRLDRPQTFDEFLARQERTERRAFRRDLRRASEAGARIVVEDIARPETLARAWPLVTALWDRKNAGFISTDETLFDAMQRYMLPEDLSLDACYLGDELVGVVLYHRAGTTVRLAYAGHRIDLEWKVYMALLASAVAREVERGSTFLHLGFTNDVQKKRLGATAYPHVHYVARLDHDI
ncbi:MAG: GNAT family N-acetyltransferase [Polyangia bacterium]